jgi:hypothetical protein
MAIMTSTLIRINANSTTTTAPSIFAIRDVNRTADVQVSTTISPADRQRLVDATRYAQAVLAGWRND